RATTTLQSLADDQRAGGWVTLLTRVADLLQAAPGGRRLRAPKQNPPGPLTPREHDVLSLVADGLTSRRIAERLGVSPATVESHVRAAMQKLGTRTRAEAAALIRDADGRA
ncbi:MAG: helix-turn-helix transcriptional regulator, partial [Baekduiaceae bacterium]